MAAIQADLLHFKPVGIYSKLAKSAAEHYIKHQEILNPAAALPPELSRQQACYVSLREKPGNKIRSMYGQILPTRGLLAEEIIFNTIQAINASPSRRVTRPDLPHLTYSIALCGPLQRVSSTEHLNPQQFGLYVTSDRGKTALLLPQRTGFETADDQMATAVREAGINSGQEAITMYRFVVEYDDG